MAKIDLNLLAYGAGEILTRNELKMVLGGVGSDDTDGTCANVAHFSPDSGLTPCLVGTGVDKATAIQNRDFMNSNLQNGEINWYGAERYTYCCDSCKNFNRCNNNIFFGL
ncbi:MAG: hypothetical protein EOM44_04780 [Bacteroidia bacterium]|nr:hypothetical protein [Bacteroidia bacterium]